MIKIFLCIFAMMGNIVCILLAGFGIYKFPDNVLIFSSMTSTFSVFYLLYVVDKLNRQGKKMEKMSSCCQSNIIWHKGESVCSCCGMPHSNK